MEKGKNLNNRPTLSAYANMLWLRSRHAWAEWMDNRFSGMGRRKQFLALLLFVGFSLATCIWLIFGGLGSVTQRIGLTPAPIEKVVIENETIIPAGKKDTVMRARIGAFHSYMDSLARSPSGKIKRDSILRARPGLLDSIKIAETMINN